MYRCAILRDYVLIALISLGLLALCSGCNRGNTSVVGKWIDTRAGESIVEFKSDGTARLDADWNKMYVRLTTLNPGKTEKVKAEVARREVDIRNLNSLGLTWTKINDEYVITVPNNNGVFKYKISSNNRLVLYNDGKPGLEFSRMN